MEQNYSYIDSSNKSHDIVLNDESFTLKQKDQNIKDTKLKTKPTTFARDALKRFAKSKAALVASIILGILILMSIIVPASLSFNTSSGAPGTQFLPPKIFSTGTGFWDGTKKYTDIVYNPETGLPDGGYSANAILDGTLSTYEGTVENTVNEFARGGYIRIASSKKDEYVYSTKNVDVLKSDTISLKYDVEANILENYAPTSYYIALSSGNNRVELVSSNSDYGTKEVDVSDKVSEDLTGYKLIVGINANNDAEKSAVFLKSLSFIVNGKENTDVSFSDANKALLKNSVFTCNSANLSGISQAVLTYCSFTYDPYEVCYGETEFTVPEKYIDDCIKDGSITYTKGDPSSLVVHSSSCYIISVISEKSTTVAGYTVTEYLCKISRYKYLGYSSMPKHVFGTNANGVDMFKYVFEGFRNSLLIAVLISAICFIIGLIIGAIEGYFGGLVDLILERVIEIISGIPTIILITLLVLNLGQTFKVFILAMCLTGWIGTSGITRTQFYRFKRREYVLASRSLGASDARLIYHHVLPNSLGTIVTSSVLMISGVIYSEASLAYLGIGLVDKSSLGKILSDNQGYISTNQHLLLFPAILLAILLICLNLFGNGLRDALNPSLKGTD